MAWWCLRPKIQIILSNQKGESQCQVGGSLFQTFCGEFCLDSALFIPLFIYLSIYSLEDLRDVIAILDRRLPWEQGSWGPDGPHVGPMNFAIWVSIHLLMLIKSLPVDTWRNDNLNIASKRRSDVVLACWLCCYCQLSYWETATRSPHRLWCNVTCSFDKYASVCSITISYIGQRHDQFQCSKSDFTV